MKKYVLVGAGARALHMFAKPMSEEWKDRIQFVGVYDTNRIRAELLSAECGSVPVYDHFDRMMETVKPDVVIVASADFTHHTYIIASLRAGCDVVTEKPMTIDAQKCQEILEAERLSGHKVTVTFNLRFAPYFAKVKELVASGVIGDVYHAALEWHVDRVHGGEYFRRWHSEMAKSGGLLVHKSTHHFDIMNWWLDSNPTEVHAFGSRRVYGPTRDQRGQRCLSCLYQSTCEFYIDITDHPFMEKYYYQAESEDGYIRDRCVFHDEIDIYDTMSVQVRYDSGALLTYSLVAYSPYEGWRATLNGSGGRMELIQGKESQIRIIKLDGSIEEVEVPSDEGNHGGGDERLLRTLFEGSIADPLSQQADSYAGALSLLIGHAANRSIKEGGPVQINDLLPIAAS